MPWRLSLWLYLVILIAALSGVVDDDGGDGGGSVNRPCLPS